MSHAEGWCWTVLILALIFAIPAWMFHALVTAVIVLLVLPVALLIFL